MNEILQKRIEEAARKYGCDAYIKYCRQHGVDAATAKHPSLENAFITGAEWMLQNMWISVEDELPEKDVSVLVCGGNSDECWFTHRSSSAQADKYGFANVCPIEITHWMSIPSLEGGKE